MNRKIYIPNNWNIQEQVLQKNHKPADVEYPGQHRMIDIIKQNKVQYVKKIGELYLLEIS